MSNSRPWFKFYSANWRGDPALRACSLAARGLWIDMITLMEETDDGTLTLRGKPIASPQLAMLVAAPLDEVEPLIEELRDNGVFMVAKNGIVFSTRMKNERKMRENGKKNARKRWGKNTKQDTEKPEQKSHPNGLPNTPARAPSRPRGQRTDAASDLSGSSDLLHGRALSNGAAKAKKPSRLPEDFAPDIVYATEQGLTAKQAIAEAENFADYWRAKPKDNTKLDWPATWRTWVRRAATQPQRAHSPPAQAEDEYEAYRRKLREEERRNAKH